MAGEREPGGDGNFKTNGGQVSENPNASYNSLDLE